MSDYRDPYRAYQFKLIVQGVTEGHFTTCSGIGVEVDVIRYREAGNNQIVHAVPGRVHYHDVVLGYGLTDSRELWDWMMATARGEVDRRNVSILMLDSQGASEELRWDLLDAWPRSWHGAPLDALAREVAIETLTLAYDRIERA